MSVCVDDVVDGLRALNLRCLEGVEWQDIETYKHPGSKEGVGYVVPE